MIAVTNHLRTAAETNPYLQAVIQHEQDKLLRVAEEFAQALDIPTDQECVTVDESSNQEESSNSLPN